MSADYERALYARTTTMCCAHRAYIVHTSCIHRAYIVHTSCTHSAHIAHTERTQSAHIVHSRLFPPFVACSPKSLLLRPVACTNVLLSGLRAQHNYQKYTFSLITFSCAQHSDLEMAGDQHSSNENGKHACESGPGCGRIGRICFHGRIGA